MTHQHDTPPTQVLAHYPALTGRATITGTPGGYTAHCWRIDTPTASFLLRRLPTATPAATALFAATAHQHAAHAGLAPPILANNIGGLVTAEAGHLFTLTRRLPEATPTSGIPDTTLSHRLGHTLGHLHQTLRDLPPGTEPPRWGLPGEPAALQDALEAHQRPGCPHTTTRRVLSAKLARAHTVPADTRERLHALDQQVIHGDIHPGNILTRNRNVAAIIDFDLARRSPPGYELMRALIYCTHPAGPPEAYRTRVTAFLRGYLTARPLTPTEIDTMTELYQAIQVFDPYGLDTCHDANPDLLSFGHARFALLYWLNRNGQHLTTLAHQAQQAAPTPDPTGPRPHPSAAV